MKTYTNTYLGYSYKPPKVIYHYCSVEVMKSILCNKNIWLSDTYKTNDKLEMYWILSNVRDVLPDIFKECAEKYKQEIVKYIDIFIESFDNIIESYRQPNEYKSKKFVTCFSEKGDLLSQWRAYGDDGFGVSIGFDTKFLKLFEDLTSNEFSKIVYNKKKVITFLKELIGEQLKYIFMDCVNDNLENTIEKIYLELSMLIRSIYDEGFIYKDPHFSEEKEWRLTQKATEANWHKEDGVDCYGYSSTIDGFFADNLDGIFTRSKLKFRTKKGDLIPYIELGFEKIHTDFIKSIILGPKCKIDKYDLILLLNSEGYIETVNDEKIRIIKSKNPYI